MMPLSLARLQPIRLSVRVFIRSLSKLSSDGFVSAPTSYDTQDDPKFDDDADRALGEAWDLQRSPSGKYRNLLQWIGQPQVLDAAVQRLKSRQLLRRTSGMGTSIDRDWMRKAPGEIRSGLYKFTPPVISTVPTPMAEAKGGAAEEEVVGVHYGDLAVQEAMYIALEKIYEEYFVDELHSFRVGRGAHSAVRQLKYLWKGCKYFVHTEIDSLYSSMDLDVLERLLHEFIEDKKFVEYVCTAFGLSLPGRNPKRNVLAPILSNVYLRELDMVVKEMQDEYNCDKLRRRHLLNGLQDAHDPNYVRINYIRYADDFIVGFSGPDEILDDILLRIRGCLSRTLNLRYTEPKVELAHTKVVSFLGFLIGFDHPRTMAQDAHNEDKRIRKAREQVKERWLSLQSAIVRYGADWLTTGLKKERLKWASYAAAKVGFCRALKTELRDLPHEFIQKYVHHNEFLETPNADQLAQAQNRIDSFWPSVLGIEQIQTWSRI
uniref:Reverse transcriptase domain-containing protein n=1 Tax=Rhodosorus marinus TaxID=101924 RepID=A0A7S2ZM60_9RHOD|mmetsp:Transcript_24599/g.97115  ORF Transcript_24599/g.97115 Transcript_24599/m.97115 type:complete len:489 (+) Transcript_24599:1898-3364(+)